MPLTRIKNKGLGNSVSRVNIVDTGTEVLKYSNNRYNCSKLVVQLVNGDTIQQLENLNIKMRLKYKLV